jgi:predicted phosphodiesterase
MTPTKVSYVWTDWEAQDLGPYIQAISKDSVRIVWETREARLCRVLYGETSDYGMVAAETQRVKQHNVKITGLDLDEDYHYRVRCAGEDFSNDLTFHTAVDSNSPFEFVVYGDTQYNHAIHKIVVNRASALKPDFIVHLGDLVNNGMDASEWIKFLQIEGDLLGKVPLYPTLGNHENGSQHYFRLFHLPGNERWYSFIYGSARFICLQIDERTNISPGSQQYRWLSKALAENTKPWLFVYFHVPVFTAMSEGPDELHIRESLTPLFEQHGVNMVFTGHHHNYQRSRAKGITYIVSGGGGGPLMSGIQPDKYLITHKIEYHLVYIKIDGKTLNASVKNISGDQIDSFTIKLP